MRARYGPPSQIDCVGYKPTCGYDNTNRGIIVIICDGDATARGYRPMNMPTFQSIEYSRPSLDNFRDCAMRVRLKIMTSHTPESVEGALLEFQKEYSRFETAMSICGIRHDLDIQNVFFREETAFFEEASAIVSELVSGVYSTLLHVENIDRCKELFGEMIFRKAQNRRESVSRDIVEHLAREATLANSYQSILSEAVIEYGGEEYNLSTISPLLESPVRMERAGAHRSVADFFDFQREKLDCIFQEMVELRTEMAKRMGFDNFVDLGYKRMERYDYTKEMAADFRELVVKYFVPITAEIRRLQRERMGYESLKFYDLKSFFALGNPVPHIGRQQFSDTLSHMFREIFGKNPSFYDVLQSHGFTDIDARHKKSTGGYCVTLPDYGIPFIFVNANEIAEDVTTLIHESGHAYAALCSADSSVFFECLSPTLETCEIHSTAMEYLTYPHMDLFFGDAADAYRELHMTQALLFLPYGCMVDEFQHVVYENPTLSPQERHAIWRGLERKYQPFLDYDGISFYENGCAWQKKGHIFTDPFYYIDYCLAQIVALELWDISRQDYRKALSKYGQLCMEGGTATFLDLLSKARLSNPFLESTMKRVAYQACRFLHL